MKKADWMIFECKYKEMVKDLEEDIEAINCISEELFADNDYEDMKEAIDLVKDKYCDLSLFNSLESIRELFDVKGVIENE